MYYITFQFHMLIIKLIGGHYIFSVLIISKELMPVWMEREGGGRIELIKNKLILY